MRQAAVITVLILTLAVVVGCNTAGPRGLRSGGVAYNQAVALTMNEQLLLNLVRLRYRDNPVFLEVSSISSQYQFTASAGIDADYVSPADVKGYGGSFGLSFSEKPTVSFSPLRGESFVKQMLSPIPLETVALLFHSGWNFDRISRCIIQGLNGVPNALNASSPTPSSAPEYEDFKRIAGAVKALQKRGWMDFGVGGPQEPGALLLTVSPQAEGTPESAVVSEVLDMPIGHGQYLLVPTVLRAPEGRIGVNTRSLSGVLYFLSQGVVVPSRHEEQGLVTVTRNADGSRFDWSDVSGDLLRVRSSNDRPDNAAVRVKYRGAWFYIADDDLNSKSTFSLLAQLIALQAGGTPTASPVLTIPLG